MQSDRIFCYLRRASNVHSLVVIEVQLRGTVALLHLPEEVFGEVSVLQLLFIVQTVCEFIHDIPVFHPVTATQGLTTCGHGVEQGFGYKQLF